MDQYSGLLIRSRLNVNGAHLFFRDGCRDDIALFLCFASAVVWHSRQLPRSPSGSVSFALNSVVAFRCPHLLHFLSVTAEQMFVAGGESSGS